MSNTIDIIQWAISLGDQCPPLAVVESALSASSAPPLAPLPAGVTFDAANTGAVFFANSKHQTQPYFWSGALPSLQKGSIQYAQSALNTVTAKSEEQFGWLIGTAYECVSSTDISTGGNTYRFKTGNDSKIVPAVFVIPDEYATLDAALAWIDKGP